VNRHLSATVTVIPRSTGTLLWRQIKQCVNDGFHDGALSVRWDSLGDEDDVEGQLTLFDSAISRQDRGIIFAPDQTLASRSLVMDAVRRRIPVVVVDDELGPAAGPYLSYVSNDERA